MTWNWARHWAERNQVWVVAHPEFRAEVDSELTRSPIPNMHVVWVDVSGGLDPLRLVKGQLGLKLHYMTWQRTVLERVRELHASIGFDFVQHVSFGTVNAPPKLWQLGIPFVWGPIGGGQTTPLYFLKYYGLESISEAIRTLQVRLVPYSIDLRRTVKSSLILATNGETLSLVRKAGATRAHGLLDGALPAEYLPPAHIQRRPNCLTTYLWAGAFLSRKGLPLGLEALAQTKARIRLIVAGQGPKENEWKTLAARLGLKDKVHFVGMLTFQELKQRFIEADALLFTSIRDSFGTVMLEAMAHSLPIIAMNHQGAAMHVPDDASIKITVTTPKKTVSLLASAMDQLADSPDLRERLGRASWDFARTQLWSQKVSHLERLLKAWRMERSMRILI